MLELATMMVLAAPPVDWCAWQESPELKVLPLRQERSGEYALRLQYPSLWAECALQGSTPLPHFTLVRLDGDGRKKIKGNDLELRGSISPYRFNSTGDSKITICGAPEISKKKGAVLKGPPGRRLWTQLSKAKLRVAAKGVYAPLAYAGQFETDCPVCSSAGPTASVSFYRVGDGEFVKGKNMVRLRIAVKKDRFRCARGGGEFQLRYFWNDPGRGEFFPLKPFKVIRHVEKKLKPEGDSMVYETFAPGSTFCKRGKTFVWEFVGLDTFSALTNSGRLGPSRFLRRGTVEFLRCK